MNYARQSFVLMKETRNLPLNLQVETLILSRRNILEQLMRIPRRGWQSLIWDDPLREGAGSRLSEMIYFGKANVTCKVSDPSFVNFNQRRSSFLVATGPLLIFIKEDPTISAIMRRITALCIRKAFRVQLAWLITLEVDRTTCMPLEQWFGCRKTTLM